MTDVRDGTSPRYEPRLPQKPTREEVASIVALAKTLTDAHARRSPSSQYATLGEEDALFNLRWHLNELQKAVDGG